MTAPTAELLGAEVVRDAVLTAVASSRVTVCVPRHPLTHTIADLPAALHHLRADVVHTLPEEGVRTRRHNRHRVVGARQTLDHTVRIACFRAPDSTQEVARGCARLREGGGTAALAVLTVHPGRTSRPGAGADHVAGSPATVGVRRAAHRDGIHAVPAVAEETGSGGRPGRCRAHERPTESTVDLRRRAEHAALPVDAVPAVGTILARRTGLPAVAAALGARGTEGDDGREGRHRDLRVHLVLQEPPVSTEGKGGLLLPCGPREDRFLSMVSHKKSVLMGPVLSRKKDSTNSVVLLFPQEDKDNVKNKMLFKQLLFYLVTNY